MQLIFSLYPFWFFFKVLIFPVFISYIFSFFTKVRILQIGLRRDACPFYAEKIYKTSGIAAIGGAPIPTIICSLAAIFENHATF